MSQLDNRSFATIQDGLTRIQDGTACMWPDQSPVLASALSHYHFSDDNCNGAGSHYYGSSSIRGHESPWKSLILVGYLTSDWSWLPNMQAT